MRNPSDAAHTTELDGRDHWSDPVWNAECRESASEVRSALAELPLPQRVAPVAPQTMMPRLSLVAA